jgi:hypothetical protein
MINDSMTVIQAVQQVGDEDLLRQLAEVVLASSRSNRQVPPL